MSGTFSGRSSTPRSPRATMMPSDSSMISSEPVERLRLLDLGDEGGSGPPGGDQARVATSWRERTNDARCSRRRASAPNAGRTVLVGQAGRRTATSGRLMPLLSLTGPPSTAVTTPSVDLRRPRAGAAVVEQQRRRAHVARQAGVGGGAALSPRPPCLGRDGELLRRTRLTVPARSGRHGSWGLAGRRAPPTCARRLRCLAARR